MYAAFQAVMSGDSLRIRMWLIIFGTDHVKNFNTIIGRLSLANHKKDKKNLVAYIEDVFRFKPHG